MSAIATARETDPGSEWFASWFGSPHDRELYGHRDEAEAELSIAKSPSRKGARAPRWSRRTANAEARPDEEAASDDMRNA